MGFTDLIYRPPPTWPPSWRHYGSCPYILKVASAPDQPIGPGILTISLVCQNCISKNLRSASSPSSRRHLGVPEDNKSKRCQNNKNMASTTFPRRPLPFPPSTHYQHPQSAHPPPSPPMEEAKYSLPSISNLINLAGAGSPTSEAPPSHLARIEGTQIRDVVSKIQH